MKEMKLNEMEKLLANKSYFLNRINGSHGIYKNNTTGKIVVIPMKKLIPNGTVRNILKTI